MGGGVVGARGVVAADVTLAGPTIVAVGTGRPGRGRVVDARGLLVAAGFIDLQVNGIAGWDLTTDTGSVWAVAEHLPRYGVTAFLPTVVSAPASTYTDAIAVLAHGPPPAWRGARPLGWHFEGPMLNPRRRGAHDERWLRPPHPDVYGSWSRGAGVALVTLAPELPGALAAIPALRAAGVVIAAGHTDATVAEINDGMAAGITSLTHLFNAMPPFGHRAPGPAGVALAGGPLVCGLIADGVHVDPLAVRLAWQALGPTRLNLVSDAVATSAGRRGPRGVHVDDGAARLTDGTLAGSVLTMDAAVRNLIRFAGAPIHEAIAAATTAPASVLGLTRKGRIEPGADADLVLLTSDLEIVTTIVGGEVVWAGGSE